MMDDLPNGHPGCIVATVCYQERLFDAEVRELNRQAMLPGARCFLADLERSPSAIRRASRSTSWPSPT